MYVLILHDMRGDVLKSGDKKPLSKLGDKLAAHYPSKNRLARNMQILQVFFLQDLQDFASLASGVSTPGPVPWLI